MVSITLWWFVAGVFCALIIALWIINRVITWIVWWWHGWLQPTVKRPWHMGVIGRGKNREMRKRVREIKEARQ